MPFEFGDAFFRPRLSAAKFAVVARRACQRVAGAVAVAAIFALSPALAQAPDPSAQAPEVVTQPEASAARKAAPNKARRARPAARAAGAAATSSSREAARRAANASTVSIISGGVTGTYLRLASEIAAVTDQDGVRVLPIIGKGSVQNVSDILFLKGVDMGFVQTDALEAIRREGKLGDVSREIAYIARLMEEEFHVVAGKDVADLRQLAGKKVNFDVAGSGTSFSATIIFDKLGIQVEPTHFDQATAFQKLNSGEIAASVFIGGKPVSGWAAFPNPERRFHLVPAPYDRTLEELYLPATVSAKEYPNLLEADQAIDTISVGTVLAAYNIPSDSDRYERLKRFVDAFFGRFDELTKPPRHAKWREVNLAAAAQGWTRFKPAQDWLDRAAQAQAAAGGGAASGADVDKFRRFVEQRRAAGALSPQEATRLMKEFQDWSKSQ